MTIEKLIIDDLIDEMDEIGLFYFLSYFMVMGVVIMFVIKWFLVIMNKVVKK